MKTAQTTLLQLNWLVAKCEGVILSALQGHGQFEIHFAEKNVCNIYSPSTDWVQAGPIIEREEMSVYPFFISGELGGWSACNPHTLQYDEDGEYIEGSDNGQDGPTPLIAAMRCYVTSKLGDEVEIPEGLK